MARPYSMDLRKRVKAGLEKGLSRKEVAERFGVSVSFVRSMHVRHETTGSLEPSKGKTGPKEKLAGYEEKIEDILEDHSDATLEELREHLGVSVSLSMLWRTLKRMGFTLKKSHLRRGTEAT